MSKIPATDRLKLRQELNAAGAKYAPKTQKEELREKIEKDTEAFLKKNKIKKYDQRGNLIN